MSWIDERLAQRKALNERNQLLDEHAAEIYAAIWKEMMTFVEEAKSKGFTDLLPNGTAQNRRLILGNPDHNRTIMLTMTDKRVIRGGSLSFELDICDGGIVCLKHDGEQVSERDAARLILDPFLFPEFSPVTSKKSVYATRGVL